MERKSCDESDYISDVLTNLCSDERVIKYRQNVFKNILSSKTLISSFETILDRLEALKLMDKESCLFREENLWAYFNKFKELDSYVGAILAINEFLASTSFTEAIYIAQDVVKSLRYLGARALFNTHMHELAKETDVINNEIKGSSKVVSLVTGIEGGRRSYKIYRGEPLGKSYARDIAEKYGVSFEQITKSIDIKKANLSKPKQIYE